ncbi:MAG: exodeoxyribonuclease VII large subunit [Pseudomonadota bacterium]|nr:exodeoxyribonuclease VII large subunit [Pseudomonadota bacterium]
MEMEHLDSIEVSEYTVTEISLAIKRAVQNVFGEVRVRGEISQMTLASSGHCYITLKDDKATLEAVIWRGQMSKLTHNPEEGLEIIAYGRLTTYPPHSKYQLTIDNFEVAGEGALLKLLEDRRKALAAEGLFSESLKKPIPFLPEIIGVVTSPTGSVIRDIEHRIRHRFPRRIVIWPVRVQGKGSENEIASAIDGFNSIKTEDDLPRPDILIIARGGGSLEDLWSFNEEVVVRAVAASKIPVISAIGHETDHTLVDFASDLRAPTPSAAAEFAVPERLSLLSNIKDNNIRMQKAILKFLSNNDNLIIGLVRGLPRLSDLVEQKQQELDGLNERLVNGPERFLELKTQSLSFLCSAINVQKIIKDLVRNNSELKSFSLRLNMIFNNNYKFMKQKLSSMAARLESVSYQSVLDRGYTIFMDSKRNVITSSAEAVSGLVWNLKFKDGDVDVLVDKEKKYIRKNRPAEKKGSLL